MPALPRLRSFILLAALALCAVGCKQENGEVCDVDEDCSSGFCCGERDLPVSRGICQAEGTTCAEIPTPRPDGGPDSGPVTEPDAGAVEDAGIDAGTVEEGGTDAGTVEDAGTDAGTVADAGTDAGTIADAGPDAV